MRGVRSRSRPFRGPLLAGLERRGTRFLVHDQHSTHGTSREGRKIDVADLYPGDCFTATPVTFVALNREMRLHRPLLVELLGTDVAPWSPDKLMIAPSRMAMSGSRREREVHHDRMAKRRHRGSGRRYRRGMRRIPWSVATLVAWLSCGGDNAPTRAPFGLDKRPSNPTCVAQPRPVIDTGVTLARQWTGVRFSQPLFLTQAPGDDATWYAVERPGKVRAFPSNATSDAQTRDFASVAVNAAGEGGLLSMAFHPEWPTRREAYLSYTRDLATGDPAAICRGRVSVFTSVVARYQSTNDGVSLDVGPDEILKVGQPFTNHDGGHLQFGADGYLYFGLGDGGASNDLCGSAQNLGQLLGKILRLDVNAPAGTYKSPADNPFAGNPAARPEIWTYGHRNPWRWSFDRASGELWLGDVGQSTWEEIDRVVKGGNYGWSPCEGFHLRGSTTALCTTPGAIDPVVEHPRSEAQSITGGYVYRGTAMPSLVGTYIYGDYATGKLWALTYDADNKPTPQVIATVTPDTLVSFAQGNDGEIYTVQLIANGIGIISKLVPAPRLPPDHFPQRLSATGCVDPEDATKAAAGLIPYDVNSPLWSDGADKERYLAIPDDKTITINPDQDWDLPVGSVAMKTFSVGGKRIETRLFMRHDDGG